MQILKNILVLLFFVSVAAATNIFTNATNTAFNSFTYGDCIIDLTTNNSYCPSAPNLGINANLIGNQNYSNPTFNISVACNAFSPIIINNVSTCDLALNFTPSNSSQFYFNAQRNVSVVVAGVPQTNTVLRVNASTTVATLNNACGAVTCVGDLTTTQTTVNQTIINRCNANLVFTPSATPQTFLDADKNLSILVQATPLVNLNLNYTPSSSTQTYIDSAKAISVVVNPIPTANSTNITAYANSTTTYQNIIFSCLANSIDCSYNTTITPTQAPQRIVNTTTGLDIFIAGIPFDYCYENRVQATSETTIFRSDRCNDTFTCSPPAPTICPPQTVIMQNNTCPAPPACPGQDGSGNGTSCNWINGSCPLLKTANITTVQEAQALMSDNVDEYARLKTVDLQNRYNSLSAQYNDSRKTISDQQATIAAAQAGTGINDKWLYLLGVALIAIGLLYWHFQRTRVDTSPRQTSASPEKIDDIGKKFDAILEQNKPREA